MFKKFTVFFLHVFVCVLTEYSTFLQKGQRRRLEQIIVQKLEFFHQLFQLLKKVYIVIGNTHLRAILNFNCAQA